MKKDLILALFGYQGRIRTYILKSRASSPAVRRLGNIFVAKVGLEPTSCTFKGCSPALDDLEIKNTNQLD